MIIYLKKVTVVFLISLIIAGAAFALFTVNNYYYISRIENIIDGQKKLLGKHGIIIDYPLNDSIFPPEIAPTTFKWQDLNPESNIWFISIKFSDNKNPINLIVSKNDWQPSDEQWETIKNKSVEKKAEISIYGINRKNPSKILSYSNISIMTSKDRVDDSIFYREVELPFSKAVKVPSHLKWRSGRISLRNKPPVIMENLSFCAGCHSFSRNSGILGMDIDYKENKSSYITVPIFNTMNLIKERIISWNNYKNNNANPTFGNTTAISPDGKHIVLTANDKFFMIVENNISFSQLTFLAKGVLLLYSIKDKTYKLLEGTHDYKYVYNSESWSPDGKFIIFSRAWDYFKKNGESIIIDKIEAEQFLKNRKKILFSIFKIPFNNRKGGNPEPIRGASNNGMSNYFPRYSPDGKWIVFCKAKSGTMLQPDSKLYIIPAQGGIAREMRCNTKLMNSWHSWSSNSRWLVFSSKANTPYTQMFLTHIDEKGQDSPPILLEHFCSSDRAINLPEFVDKKFGMIKKINIQF